MSRKTLYMIVFCFVAISISKGYSQDLKKIDSLNFMLETTRIDSAKVDLLIQLSREYLRGDLALAVIYGERAVEMAEASKKKELIAKSLINLGNAFFFKGMLENAARQYYRSLQIQKELNNTEGVANALTNLAGIQLQLKNYLEAEEFLFEALDMYQKVRLESEDTLPPRQLITVYNNLGIVYQNIGQFSLAIEYLLRGVSLASRMPNEERDLGNLYNNLGSTYTDMFRDSLAVMAMGEALRIRIDQQR
jgi:tetratricopeptide (TPR) repeat protein